MNKSVLAKVDTEIGRYKNEHQGQLPLYLLVSAHEQHILLDEVKKASGVKSDAFITTYKDMKIVRHDTLKDGELLMTNELPETGS